MKKTKRLLVLVLTAAFSLQLTCGLAFAASAKDNEKKYAEVLDQICNAIDDKWSWDKIEAKKMSMLYDVESFGASKSNIGYAFKDLNKDGVDELLLGNDYTITDMYTIVKGSVKHIFSATRRSTYTLCEGNYIRNSVSGGAANFMEKVYKFNGKSLSFVEGIWSELDFYDEYSDYEYVDYYYQKGKGIVEDISEEDFDELLEYMEDIDYPETTIKYTALRYYGAPKLIPRSTKLSSAANAKGKKLTVKWKKNTTATAYQIQYSTDKKYKTGAKTVTVSGNKTTSKTISGLKKNKTYYVRIRSVKKVNGKARYSPWSGSKKVKITK